MVTKYGSGVGMILAIMVAAGVLGCGSESDRPAETEEPTKAREQETDRFDLDWGAIRRTAERDLEVLERELEAARESLAEVERALVDRWSDRVKRARAEIAKQIAEAPDKRRRDKEEFVREIEEIKREGAALLARLRGGKAASSGDESQD